MTTWAEFAAAKPELATEGRRLFEATRLCLLGSIRKDGSPRISPVEILFVAGEPYLGMMWRSKKVLDLLRDPRCLIHNAVNDPDAKDGDYKVRGRAVDVTDKETRERYAAAFFAAAEFRVEDPFHLFTIEIEDVTRLSFDKEMQVERWVAP